MGTVEVRITDSLPGDGNTKFTGGELFGTFTGSDAEKIVSLRNKPTQGTFVLVQRDQGKHPNNIFLMDEIRVFGTTGKCCFATCDFFRSESSSRTR